MKIDHAVVYWLIHIKLNRTLEYAELSATRKGYTQLLIGAKLADTDEAGFVLLTEKGELIISELTHQFKELIQ